uniref:Ig-like domain-containing protein n=1 Tax=Sphaeramia orbicularis TaxID=375764 RepID=A0A673AHQ9_9TELE
TQGSIHIQCWFLAQSVLLTVSTCPPSDDPVLKPVVGVYPAASTAPDGKTSLMCVASGMSPPEVRFSWKRQKDHGTEEDLPDAQGEQLEVQESGRRTSIRTIHQNHNSSDKYWCTVQHEGGTTHQGEGSSFSFIIIDHLQFLY